MKKPTKPAKKTKPPYVYAETQAAMRRRSTRAVEKAHDPSEKYESLCVAAMVLPRGTTSQFMQLAQFDGLKAPDAIARLILQAVHGHKRAACELVEHGRN